MEPCSFQRYQSQNTSSHRTGDTNLFPFYSHFTEAEKIQRIAKDKMVNRNHALTSFLTSKVMPFSLKYHSLIMLNKKLPPIQEGGW